MVNYEIKKEYVSLDEQKRLMICEAIQMIANPRILKLEELEIELERIGSRKAGLILEAIKTLNLRENGWFTLDNYYRENFFDYIKAKNRLI